MDNEEIFELSDLVTIWLAIGNDKEITGTERIICKALNNGENFQDIITGTIYPLNHFKPNNFGKIVAFKPNTIAGSLKDANQKNTFLSKKNITREEAIKLYHIINGNKFEKTCPNYCTILNKKEYLNPPAIFREEELEQLMISLALNKKIAILYGPSGIGKTSIVEQLAYLIKTNNVPDFLKDKQIIEINIDELNKPRRNIQDILTEVKRTNSILYIDNINETNPINDKNISILIHEAERKEIKVIFSTTNPEYNNINNNTLKNKFDVIEIKEPDENTLFKIAKNEIENQSRKRNISIKEINKDLDEIITIILGCTIKNQTNAINQINYDTNPGFTISIIDKCFATAQVKNASNITIEHILKIITSDKRIRNEQKIKATELLETLKPKTEKPKLFFKK